MRRCFSLQLRLVGASLLVGGFLLTTASADALAGSPRFSAPKTVRAGGDVRVSIYPAAAQACSIKVRKLKQSATVFDPSRVQFNVDRVYFTIKTRKRSRSARLKIVAACDGSKKTLVVRLRGRKGGTSSPLSKHIKVGFRFSKKPLGDPTRSNSLPSFQAVYAVPNDQPVDQLHPDLMRSTIETTNSWFATQTRGAVRPRWRRDPDGRISVKVVNLPQPLAAVATFDTLLSTFKGLGMPAKDGIEKIVVFGPLGNGSTGACGTSSSPQNFTVIWEPVCNIHPAIAAWPGGGSYLTAHEMTHAFGAVNECAPHHGYHGHATDDPRDVIYSGDQPRDWKNLQLDTGHDDYYLTGSPSCPGIESSPFWTATSDPYS